ncbi:GNAT family N-acetyltransferase [Mycolicibacterium sp. F2034L]|uniref:GNAT family N-acetyltransferase n=1 Tax=Mycolicibacterium sp. F2034L TaxID=2926422 RepID=UPI001FF3F5B9|nr:GNAT family N-acetyltransferase [Mycolicibacterium sp. F2034L]MCK0175899.1 GNAT family N-acetyltransferase [Mycolicibacterium sp. F2034L]
MESTVDLELIDYRRGRADDRWWMPPFDWAVVYEHPHWWNRQLGDDPWFVQVLECDVEVARIEFDDPGGINPSYANVPVLGDERLEIQFIEVASVARGRGIGTEVVHRLADRHPGRRLFAYSEEADRFWVSVGWEPLYDPGPGSVGRTLFIQPLQ